MATSKKIDFEDYRKNMEEAERLKNLETVRKFKAKVKNDRLVNHDRKKRTSTENDWKLKMAIDRKSTRLNSSHVLRSRMPSSA